MKKPKLPAVGERVRFILEHGYTEVARVSQHINQHEAYVKWPDEQGAAIKLSEEGEDWERC